MGFLKRLGNLIIGDIIACCVVSFWNTMWSIHDTYVFPADHELSNGLSLSLGIIGITALSATQKKLTTYLRKTNKCFYFLCSRFLGLFWASCCVCHWRGLWHFLDKYNDSFFPFALLSASAFLLCILRSVRNLPGPPFVIGIDGRNEYFIQPVMFSRITKCKMPVLVDAFLCVSVLGSTVVVFWRDLWTILDVYLYPDDKLWSVTWSAGIFIGTQIFGELVQSGSKNIEKSLRELPFIVYLLIQDVFFLVLCAGDVACWRAIWMTADVVLLSVGSDLGRPILCAASYLVLVMAFTSTSVVIKGYIVDGEQPTWYELPNRYLERLGEYCRSDAMEVLMIMKLFRT